jgi:hypothetical protein
MILHKRIISIKIAALGLWRGLLEGKDASSNFEFDFFTN